MINGNKLPINIFDNRELISAKEKAFLLFSELANLKMVFDRTIISSKNMEHSSLVVEEQVSGNIPGTLLHPRSMSSSSPNGQRTDTCSIEETKNDLFISEANEILKDFKINMPGFLLDL